MTSSARPGRSICVRCVEPADDGAAVSVLRRLRAIVFPTYSPLAAPKTCVTEAREAESSIAHVEGSGTAVAHSGGIAARHAWPARRQFGGPGGVGGLAGPVGVQGSSRGSRRGCPFRRAYDRRDVNMGGWRGNDGDRRRGLVPQVEIEFRGAVVFRDDLAPVGPQEKVSIHQLPLAEGDRVRRRDWRQQEESNGRAKQSGHTHKHLTPHFSRAQSCLGCREFYIF